MSQQKISREDFYDRLWKTPIVQLGKELGLSYVEMVQLSKKLNVPRPEAGYWYRRKRGSPEERIPLPTQTPNTPLEIELGQRRLEQFRSERKEDKSPEPISTPEVVPGDPAQASETENQSRSVKTAPELPKQPTKVQYTREELYEAIWTTSCQKLAATLGISDVALAKTCKRLGVPRPSLGYWARIAAGEKVRKTPLPTAKDEQNRTIVFDVTANLIRRKEWKATQGDVDDLAVDLQLPTGALPLHALAQKHEHALQKKETERARFCADHRKGVVSV